MIRDARAYGKHPSEIAGRPETLTAACWSNWTRVAEGAEAEAQRRRQSLDATMFQVQAEMDG